MEEDQGEIEPAQGFAAAACVRQNGILCLHGISGVAFCCWLRWFCCLELGWPVRIPRARRHSLQAVQRLPHRTRQHRRNQERLRTRRVSSLPPRRKLPTTPYKFRRKARPRKKRKATSLSSRRKLTRFCCTLRWLTTTTAW